MTLQKVSQIFTKILLKALHTKLFHIVFSVIFLTLGTTSIFSQENPIPGTVILTKSDLEKVKDSTAFKIFIEYDSQLIPNGYTEKDIQTFHFDRDYKKK